MQVRVLPVAPNDIIMHIDNIINTKHFKDAFWNWWDNLPPSERHLFDYNNNDWSYLNFYNRVYRRMTHNNGKDCSTGGNSLSN